MVSDDITVDDQERGLAGLFELTPEGLGSMLTGWKEPTYRAKQLLEWIYSRRTESIEQMTNLPLLLRDRLVRETRLYESVLAERQESSDGTTKLLLRWADGATSECVLIPDGDRRTACLSTQVGCPVGCVFCASGLGGLERQLSAGQIVEQAMRVQQLCGSDHRVSNVVFMGLGEPLANYDATVRAVRTINASWGMGIGARKITISTVGLPSQMRRLADEGLQTTLALSLHAPDDALRARIIPWAKRVSMETLVEACIYYFTKTGREVTLEYILLGGLNDTDACACALGDVSRKMRSNVNLIPYNPVAGLPYDRPTEQAVRRFWQRLRDRGINAHIRRSRGLDVDAACGQLRNHAKKSGVH